MWHQRWLRFVGFVLIGTGTATLCDANHAYTGTLVYPHPAWGYQAWWVPVGFAIAFASMGLVYTILAPAMRGDIATDHSRSAGTPREAVEAIVLFAMVYLASGFGHDHPALLTIIFYGTFLLRWGVTYERPWVMVLSVMMATGGMYVEGAMSTFHLVAYSHQDIFHVPWWLGGLYMHGAFALREGMRWLWYGAPNVD